MRNVYTLVIFVFTTVFLYADQNLLSPNLTMCANEFGFNDEERDWYLGGMISAAFFLCGAPSALLVGYLSDTINRRKLFVFIVFFGEGPCLLTYFVSEYWHLFVLRLLTGISVGGSLPVIFSILGDVFPANKRNLVSAAFGIAAGGGIFLGQVLAGWIGGAYGSWRTPFVVVSVPALVSAFVILLTTQEPTRAGAEFDSSLRYTEKITCRKFLSLFKTKVNVLAFAQGLSGCVPWGVIFAYLSDYLSNDKGFTILQATTVLTSFGAGGVAGAVGGGLAGQKLHNCKQAYVPALMGVTTLLAIVPCLYLFNYANPTQLGSYCAVAAAAGLLSSVTGSNVKAVLLNVNLPEVRGTVFSIFTLFDDIGKGTGPFFAAALISALGSRQTAFNVAIWAWAVCGVCLLLMVLYVDTEADAVTRALQSAEERALSLQVKAQPDHQQDRQQETGEQNTQHKQHSPPLGGRALHQQSSNKQEQEEPLLVHVDRSGIRQAVAGAKGVVVAETPCTGRAANSSAEGPYVLPHDQPCECVEMTNSGFSSSESVAKHSGLAANSD